MAGRPQFSNTVEVAGGSVLGINSLYGSVDVGTAAVELKIGEVSLVNRTGLYIQADSENTDIICLGLDDTVARDNAFAVLSPGVGYSIDVDTDTAVPIFAISAQAGQVVHVCEVKK